MVWQRGDTEAQNGYTFCMLLGHVAITCRFQAQLCYVILMQLSLKPASYGHLPQQPWRDSYFCWLYLTSQRTKLSEF